MVCSSLRGAMDSWPSVRSLNKTRSCSLVRLLCHRRRRTVSSSSSTPFGSGLSDTSASEAASQSPPAPFLGEWVDDDEQEISWRESLF